MVSRFGVMFFEAPVAAFENLLLSAASVLRERAELRPVVQRDPVQALRAHEVPADAWCSATRCGS
jgi:hypothetical protein